MKLAIVDHINNAGGGSRFIRNLIYGLRNRFPEVHIDFFGSTLKAARDGLLDHLTRLGVRFKPLSSQLLSNQIDRLFPSAGKAVRLFQANRGTSLRRLPCAISGNTTLELETRIKGYDAAYFAWPYFLECPELDCPMSATFHDFNFKYFFGSPVFDHSQITALERQMPVWLKRTTPIVSSEFMKSELQKFYPFVPAEDIRVIHLGPLCADVPLDRELSLRMISKMGVHPPYFLYPANLCAHKNLGPLIAAMGLLWKLGVRYPLVLTGPGTASITGRASPIGVEIGLEPKNVIGLGYVSHLEMDCLIMNASVVTTSSLYEAGNGPGVDAWSLGSPVAMSDIPAFTEHLRLHGVRAKVFNPRSPDDIASKIIEILTDTDRRKEDLAISRQAMNHFTWQGVAKHYMDVFSGVMEV